MKNFYDYLTEISKDMEAGLIRIESQDTRGTHRWEKAVKEAKEAGGQSFM